MTDIQQLQNLKDNETILFNIQNLLSEILKEKFQININPTEIEINKTQNESFGDFSTNIALKLSKELGKNPREIAEEITNYKLQITNFIEKIEIAGPGFINFFIQKNYYLENLESILSNNEAYGKWEVANEKIMVEFGQPNTHKAFHVGHLKSAITGLALVRITENLGFDVVKANFYGDVGMHVAKCIWGFRERMRNPEQKEVFEKITDVHERMKFLDDCYVLGANKFKEDDNIEKEIRQINTEIYTRENEETLTLYLQTKEWSLEHLNDTFKKLGIIYDRQYPESEIYENGLSLVKENIGKIFIEDQGAIIFPGEKYGLERWVFITKDGNPTYSAKDLGLAYKKFEEHPDMLFNITSTSVEQNAYFKGVIKTLELLSEKFQSRYYHLGFGWLLRNNKKTSSRMGGSIKGMDIINEAISYAEKKVSEEKSYSDLEKKEIAEKVALSGLKFLILSHEIHKDINYDPEQFLNPEGFSGPYLLYGYVRAKSILKQVSNFKLKISNYQDINESELQLLKLLAQFPNITLNTGKNLSPHILCNYLFDLTQAFNQFYRENKVLVEDESIKNFRLKLTKAVSIVLKNGLDLLGIETIEQM